MCNFHFEISKRFCSVCRGEDVSENIVAREWSEKRENENCNRSKKKTHFVLVSFQTGRNLSKQRESNMAPPVALPTADELALQSFASSVLDLFTIWPALRLAISQGWGSSNGRTHMAEDIVDLFYTTAVDESATTTGDKIPELDDIESVLLHVLSHEYSLTLEDNSERLIARDLVGLWGECIGTNSTTRREEFRIEAEKARAEDGTRVYAAQRDGESDEESGSGSEDGMDEDGDEEMEGGAGAGGKGREKVVDEEGFEMVMKKGGRR